MSRVRRAVVGEPLDFPRRLRGTEAGLETEGDQVADVSAVEVPVCRDPSDRLAVAAVETEGDADFVAAPAPDFEHVAAPAHVAGERDDLADWRTSPPPDGPGCGFKGNGTGLVSAFALTLVHSRST